MAVCHRCHGPTPPYKHYCVTCNLLCSVCAVRIKHGKSPRCIECQAKQNRAQHEKRSPEEVRRATVRAAISYAIRRGRMQRTPCAECGGPGDYVHFPAEISVAGAVFLCKPHHLKVRPYGPRGPTGVRPGKGVKRGTL